MHRCLVGIGLILGVSLAGFARADDPAPTTRWDFDSENQTRVTAHGEIRRDQPGPRSPEFPDFSAENTAIKLGGDGARLVLEDSGSDSAFDFTNGDDMTLEAWVRVEEINSGEHRYVIGKGRTGNPGFSSDNQNWALRLHEQGGLVRLNFLFATSPEGGSGHWHRWTSKTGFHPKTGWHHVAVTYRFGKPDSIRGWIDGTPSDGTWDMAGPTERPPVVDDDAIWIGSSMGGASGSSFEGLLDGIAIHRSRLSDEVLAARFNRKGGPVVIRPATEVMPTLDVPDGRVLVTFSEGLPARDRWLYEHESWPEETTRWLGESFLLPRMPLRYGDWGIRDNWDAPVLVRMAADVTLPPGKHRFLLRARELGRLWIDGKLIARTEAVTYRPPDGEEPVTPVTKPPKPGLRPHDYHQQEIFAEALVGPDGTCRIVLELVVGGQGLRTEPGEVCVAVETADGQSFHILQSAGASEDPLPLTDAHVEPALERIEKSLAKLDDQTRRRAATNHDDYWNQRHEAARTWAEEHPLSQPPPSGNSKNSHPIDAFITAKIERALAASDGTNPAAATHFHEKVLPILRENCVRCHGDKEKGGLLLTARNVALEGGDSGLPAIVPGDTEASELIARVRGEDIFTRMPPTGDGLSDDQIRILEEWIASGAAWPAPPVDADEVAFPPVIDDQAFLRRVYLDTIGIPPGPGEIRGFLADSDTHKRRRVIDQLLGDERTADNWMGYWQDMLAENPTLLNMSLNSTGPFRWFLYDSLRDNKPLDRMVTELIMLRGDPHAGGSAGFGIAAENDAPFAAKGHIVASAFLGIELQCARCHDSPYHTTLQRDLYSLAAMFSRKSVTVPETSRVPAAFFEKKGRESLIQVTLEPGEAITPEWPFAEVTGASLEEVAPLMRNPKDTREQLAALITAPHNERFPRVVVNRIWKRLMGAGFVEPVHDWEGHAASHPKLLDWLARELVTHDYDIKHIMRLILTSQAYQREASGHNLDASPEMRFFNAPERRRLTAEQIVDSLHAAAGMPMDVEELTFVHDGRRPIGSRQSMGSPHRAWMFASLNNERDRPSLSLPRARAVVDVLKAFGWNGSRQQPGTQRETAPNVLQPGILANGTLSMTLTRAAHESTLAQLALESDSPDALVETIFLRFLGRFPTPAERAIFVPPLAENFDARRVPADEIEPPAEPPPLPLVTWFNHLRPDANTIQRKIEERTKQGPPPDPRLSDDWRKVYEDFVWSLVNTREFVWMP